MSLTTDTNWISIRNDVAAKLLAVLGPSPGSALLAQVQVVDTEDAADEAIVSFPGAVVRVGQARRVGDTFGTAGITKCQAELTIEVFYYSSGGGTHVNVDDSIGALCYAGRGVLNGFTPTSQMNNENLLEWERDESAEKHGPRGDGTDGAKLKQTYTLRQVIFGTVS